MKSSQVHKIKGKCFHCEMDLKKRNPSGFCDHLHYPENCYVCYEFLVPVGKNDPKLTVTHYSDFKLNSTGFAECRKVLFDFQLGVFNLTLTKGEKKWNTIK